MSENISEQEKKRILKRLRKILALTESSNPGEAAAALHQANVLMEKYGLDHNHAEASVIEEVEMTASGPEFSIWENALVGVVTTALGVVALIKKYKKERGFTRPKAIVIFIGESHKSQIALYAFETLRRKLRQAMKQSFEEMLLSAGVAANALKINAQQRDAYARAWCAAVHEKVAALAPPVSQVVTRYLATRTISKPKPSKAKAKPKPSKVKAKSLDPLAFHMLRKGLSDGSQVQLHHAVHQGNSPKQLAFNSA